MKRVHFAVRLKDRTNALIGAVGIGTMTALTFFTVLDIVMRRLFSTPFTFSYELTQLMLVVIVFCSIPYATGKARHVSIEVLADRFPQKYQIFLRTAGDLFCTAVLAMLCWQACLKGAYESRIGTMTGELEIPLYPFYFFVAFGAFLAAVSLLIRTWVSFKEAAP